MVITMPKTFHRISSMLYVQTETVRPVEILAVVLVQSIIEDVTINLLLLPVLVGTMQSVSCL